MATVQTVNQTPATPEEIWATLDRVAKYHEETAKQQQENERRWKEGIAMREAEDARQKAMREAEDAKRREEEARRQAMREAEDARRKAVREAEDAKQREEEAKRSKAADERGERLDRRLDQIMELWDKADRQLKATKEEMGGMSNTFGEIVEHLVVPGVEERFGDLGLSFNQVSPRRKVKDADGRLLLEIDLLLENDDTIVVVEVKSKPRKKDLARQKEKIEILREFLHGKNDRRRILGAMAGAVFGTEQRKEALGFGLYVMVQTGDTMRMEIPEGFKPQEW